jgi:hypothetical protein
MKKAEFETRLLSWRSKVQTIATKLRSEKLYIATLA